jgi:hypothetical protein
MLSSVVDNYPGGFIGPLYSLIQSGRWSTIERFLPKLKDPYMLRILLNASSSRDGESGRVESLPPALADKVFDALDAFDSVDEMQMSQAIVFNRRDHFDKYLTMVAANEELKIKALARLQDISAKKFNPEQLAMVVKLMSSVADGNAVEKIFTDALKRSTFLYSVLVPAGILFLERDWHQFREERGYSVFYFAIKNCDINLVETMLDQAGWTRLGPLTFREKISPIQLAAISCPAPVMGRMINLLMKTGATLNEGSTILTYSQESWEISHNVYMEESQTAGPYDGIMLILQWRLTMASHNFKYFPRKDSREYEEIVWLKKVYDWAKSLGAYEARPLFADIQHYLEIGGF